MKFLAFTLAAVLSASQTATASCWRQCVLKNPVNGKCVKSTNMCNPGDDPLHTNDLNKLIRRQALFLAQAARSGGIERYHNCVIVVAAGLVAWGASYGGPVGAAVGAGAGIPAAELACDLVGLKS